MKMARAKEKQRKAQANANRATALSRGCAITDRDHQPTDTANICMICEYELIFGEPPRALLRKYGSPSRRKSDALRRTSVMSERERRLLQVWTSLSVKAQLLSMLGL